MFLKCFTKRFRSCDHLQSGFTCNRLVSNGRFAWHGQVTLSWHKMDGKNEKSVSKVAKIAKLESPGIKGRMFIGVWICKKLQRFVWKILLVSKVCSPAIFSKQIHSSCHKNSLATLGCSNLATFIFFTRSFHFCHLFCTTTVYDHMMLDLGGVMHCFLVTCIVLRQSYIF